MLERVTRIELALSAWEAEVLPLNYTRAAPVTRCARPLYPAGRGLSRGRRERGRRVCGGRRERPAHMPAKSDRTIPARAGCPRRYPSADPSHAGLTTTVE